MFAANIKAPDGDRAARLRAFVEGGGGLLLSVGDNADPDAWNEALGDLLPQPLATVAWLYLSLFGSVIAYSAYMTLLANTRPALATSNSFVNPVIAMLLGVSIGGEIVTRQEWLTVGVIVLGVTVLVLGRR